MNQDLTDNSFNIVTKAYNSFQESFCIFNSYDKPDEIITAFFKAFQIISENSEFEIFLKDIYLIYPSYFYPKSNYYKDVKGEYDLFSFKKQEHLPDLENLITLHLLYYEKKFPRISKEILDGNFIFDEMHLQTDKLQIRNGNDVETITIEGGYSSNLESFKSIRAKLTEIEPFMSYNNEIFLNENFALKAKKIKENVFDKCINEYYNKDNINKLRRNCFDSLSKFVKNGTIDWLINAVFAHLQMAKTCDVLYVFSTTGKDTQQSQYPNFNSNSKSGYGGVFVLINKQSKNIELIKFFIHLITDFVSIAIAHLISKNEIKKSQIRSAIAAIMSRNMSHNIGSHVITNTKTELERLALNNNNLQPKLSGLAKLLHYIQERQDFIAVLSSGESYTKGPVNLKEHIFDFIAYDGPAIRHQSKERFNNFILDNIISSEKITRYGSGLKIEMCLTLNEGEESHTLKSLTTQSAESRKLASIYFAIPYGLNGRQAFLTIIENFIRNSAKHLQNDITDTGLEISIIVKKESNSYNVIIQDNKQNFEKVIKNINKPDNPILEKEENNENRYRIKYGSLKILDHSESKPDHNHKGLKEMLICLAWMKGNDDYSIIEQDPSSDLGFYIINNNNNFAISFFLDCFEESILLKEKTENNLGLAMGEFRIYSC